MKSDLSINLTAASKEMDRMAGTTKSPKQEKAHIEYSKEAQCPYCQKAMVRSFAAGQPIHLCREDRYVAPMSNEVLARIEAEMKSGFPDLQFS